MTAPIEPIEGGALGSPSTTSSLNGAPSRPAQSPNYPAPSYSPPAYQPPQSGGSAYETPTYSSGSGAAAGAGLAYVIQPGDTISGVGRRFQTPVQTLIDLNNLGPRGTITAGQRVILPDTAVDTGSDPYATGPAPAGVTVPRAGRVPPPPPPPSGNAALPAASRPSTPAPAPASVPARAPAVQSPTSSAPVAGAIAFQWPVRGDIVKPFGPVAMGERNNGINIGASAGAVVSAAAAGRVAYVGDATGQGLTVIVVHSDGWRTVYAHLGSSTVQNNADVRAGQQIGTVGLTAGDGRPSIHFETRRMQGDNPVAIDPLTVLPR
jgi:murein DD-endopeptidase MepM/ murein hydrolase activator NlpD